MVYLRDYIKMLELQTSYGLKHFVPTFDEVEIKEGSTSISLNNFLIYKMITEVGDRDVSIEEIAEYLMVEEL